MKARTKWNYLSIILLPALPVLAGSGQGAAAGERATPTPDRPPLKKLDVLNVVPVESFPAECYFVEYERFQATVHDTATRHKITTFWRQTRQALCSERPFASFDKVTRITILRLGRHFAGFLEGDFNASDAVTELTHQGWSLSGQVPRGADIGKVGIVGTSGRFLVLAQPNNRESLESQQAHTVLRMGDFELPRLLEQNAPALCYAGVYRTLPPASIADSSGRLGGLIGWAVAVEPGKSGQQFTAVFEFQTEHQAERSRRACEAGVAGWNDMAKTWDNVVSKQDNQFIVVKGRAAPTADSLHAFLGDNFYDNWSRNVRELPDDFDEPIPVDPSVEDARKAIPKTLLLLPPSSSASGTAAKKPPSDPAPFVLDRAGIIDVDDRWGVERMLRDLHGKSGITVKLLTVPTTDGEGFIPFVDRYARQWGLAGERDDYGALIVVMPRGPGHRGHVRIQTAYRVHEVLSDSWCSNVSEEVVRRLFSRGHLSEGSVSITTKVADRLAEAAHVPLYDITEYTRAHEKPSPPTVASAEPNANGNTGKPELPIFWKPWEKNVVRVFGSLKSRHARPITAVAYSPDGRFVLAAGDALALSDARTGERVRTFGGIERIVFATFSTDGSLVMAVAHGKPPMFVAWDVASGREKRRWPLPDFAALTDAVLTLDGKYAALGLRHTGRGKGMCALVKLDAPGVPGAFSLEARTRDPEVAVSGDGSRYACVADRVEVRSMTSNEPLLVLRNLTEPIALSPDGKRLVINNDPVQVWDIDKQQKLFSLPSDVPKVLDVAFSADGTRIITGAWDSDVRVWNANTGEPVAVLRGHTSGVTHVALDAHGMRAVSSSSDHTVRLWNVQTRREDPERPGHDAPVLSVGYDADQRILMSAARRGPLRIWNADTGELRDWLENSVHVEGHPVIGPTAGLVGRVYSDPSGSLGYDFIVAVFAEGHKDVPKFSGNRPIAFNADRTHIALRETYDTVAVARIWPKETVATIDDLRELHRGHLALNSDATKLAYGNILGEVTIWSLPGAEKLNRFQAHDKDVSALAFTPDGVRLASASSSGDLKLWDVSSGKCVYTKQLPTIANSLCFTPDGKRLFTGNRDTSIVLWEFDFPK